ncbi:MAG TPA: glycosyltransferase family A protein [Pyrinomonadaceae bacterium]|nr:glycosyltransferase family A protein [Pyrinomonadaceae bacterium]
MNKEYTGTIIVIPTRNRAAIAESAIRSVLQQKRADTHILVSDNSTEPAEIARLADFCQNLDPGLLHYTKPPTSLPMAPHWDWALHRAFELYDCSHVTFLTDRMVFKPGALAALAEIATQAPNQIISYMHDRIADNQRPVRLDQHPWSGKLYAVTAARLLELSSQSVLHEMLPRMLNSLVPRQILGKLEHRYGKFFDSHAPDFNFCYRALEMEESIIFYDAALLVHYALDRSNGALSSSGVTGADREDFISDLTKARGYFATPIPEILTARNCVAHEYCVTREETQSAKFPPLERQSYLTAISGEVNDMTNPQLKRELQELLIASGLAKPGLLAQPKSLAQKLVASNTLTRKLAREVRTRASANGSVATKPPEFATFDAAFDYAIRRPRPRFESQPALEEMFGLVRLPLETPVATFES